MRRRQIVGLAACVPSVGVFVVYLFLFVRIVLAKDIVDAIYSENFLVMLVGATCVVGSLVVYRSGPINQKAKPTKVSSISPISSSASADYTLLPAGTTVATIDQVIKLAEPAIVYLPKSQSSGALELKKPVKAVPKSVIEAFEKC